MNKKRIIIILILFVGGMILTQIGINYYFHYDQLIKLNRYIYYFLRFLFTIIVFLISYGIVYIFQEIKNGNQKIKRLLKYIIIALIINFVFLLITWPGNWVWDELYLIEPARNFVYDIWQHYFTIIFYSLSMMLFPSPISISIVQLLVISFCFGFLVYKIEDILKNKKIVYFLYILLFLPAIISNNLYPLRITMYTYIELFFIVFLVFKKIEKSKLITFDYVLIIINVFILCQWRSEGIYYLLSPVIICFVFTPKNKIKHFFFCLLSFIIPITSITIINNLNNNYNKLQSVKYEITPFLNPLSVMLQNKNLNGNINENFKKIEKVINLSVLKKNWSYYEIPAFWSEQDRLIKKDYFLESNIKEFKKGYFFLIKDNPLIFLKARFKTFLATNGIGSINNNSFNDLNSDIGEEFKSNIISKPINNDIRMKFIKFVCGSNSDNTKNQIFQLLFWNIIPILIFLLSYCLFLIFKRKYLLSIVYLLPLIRVGLVYLTAPASYFMYYFPSYLEGLVLLSCLILVLLDKKLAKKRVIKYEKDI